MQPSRILAVDHVELTTPPGLEEALRWFYGELVQLDEMRTADEESGRLIRFRSARIELRIAEVDKPAIDELKCRVTILVPSLSDVISECAERGMEFTWISGIVMADRRIQLLDPARNRIELKQGSPFAAI